MLKHILTGQPSSAGSRHHQNDYQTSSGSLHGAVSGLHLPSTHHLPEEEHHHHHHYMSSIQARGGAGGRGTGSDVYDSLVLSPSRSNAQSAQYQNAVTSSSTHRHSLNHSQLSVNNLSQRLNHSHALNLSILSTSKHSVNSVSPISGSKSNANNNDNNDNNDDNNNNSHNNNVQSTIGQTLVSQIACHHDRPKANGGLDISRLSRLPSQATPSPAPALHPPATIVATATGTTAGTTAGITAALQPPGVPAIIPLNTSWSSSLSRHHRDQDIGIKEMLTSLGLLCLVSLLLALLSLIFLLKISPLTITPSSLISPEEYTIIYEVTLALCALALSLNLCCLLVCAIQFLFAVKLVKNSQQGYRSNKYLQKSSISRIFAVGGFFISIPVFLTGMILYTFIQFHSTPAIVTSVFIGLGIIFCGCAMVHNVFVWQKEKTHALKALAQEQYEAAAQLQRQQMQHQHHQQQQQQQQQRQQQQQQKQKQHQQHQQQQYQQQQQVRPTLAVPHGTCLSKMTGLAVTHLNTADNRGSQYPQQLQHQHHHHHHHHRHVSMSPSLSPTYGEHNAGLHRNVSTPPATPGDRSPTSPTSKLNRSQYLPREISGSVSPGLPAATLDLSSAATTNSPHELSTLV